MYDIKSWRPRAHMVAKVAKKGEQRRRHVTGHRLKFAVCARLCKGDNKCMAKCLKGQ